MNVPPASVAGSKIGGTALPPTRIQLPPDAGLPPSISTIANGGWAGQITMMLSVPGSRPGSKVIVTLSVTVQPGKPAGCTATMYWTVPPTVTTGDGTEGSDSPAAGVQAQVRAVVAPVTVACSATVPPQLMVSGPASTTKGAPSATVKVSVAVQPSASVIRME